MALTAADLVPRTSNEQTQLFAANTFATHAELAGIIKFRVDHGLWDVQPEEEQVRVAVAAYEDLIKLCWSNERGTSQSKDYEFQMRFGSGVNEPPIEDAEFLWRITKAQAVQALYILAGTQVRDMAREGIRLTRALSGSDMEFIGYLGPACAEAKELLTIFLELQMRLLSWNCRCDCVACGSSVPSGTSKTRARREQRERAPNSFSLKRAIGTL